MDRSGIADGLRMVPTFATWCVARWILQTFHFDDLEVERAESLGVSPLEWSTCFESPRAQTVGEEDGHDEASSAHARAGGAQAA